MPPKLSEAYAALSLYRQILQVHSIKLPPPMRELGNRVVREEFAAHLRPGQTSSDQWAAFLTEWTRYKEMISGAADLHQQQPSTTGAKMKPSDLRLGETNDVNLLVTGIDQAGQLTDEVLAKMDDGQKARLEALRQQAMLFGHNLVSKPGNSGDNNN